MVKNANKKPDIDNLAACVLNAAVKSGIITDDSRVIELHVRKETSKTLGMKFKISGYYYELENNNRGLQENN
jgi:Holliday junction resolvase RusA-like endonuclease